MLSIIIPAWNEEMTIGRYLASLASQGVEIGPGREVEIIVVANACTDGTANVARGWQPLLAARDMSLHVFETAGRGKPQAFNLGDRLVAFASRVYLDADVELSPSILRDIYNALDALAPRFVGGTFRLMPPVARSSRLFARVWMRMPFLAEVAPASGLNAVNAECRKRWNEFPDIISDDSYVRALFAPEERMQVKSTYQSPLAEGASPYRQSAAAAGGGHPAIRATASRTSDPPSRNPRRAASPVDVLERSGGRSGLLSADWMGEVDGRL